ncbi:MAG: TonB family protein [Thermodesulfobacteriota bacterium]
MSIKKIPSESQDWFIYFIIASLLIHGAVLWSVIIMSEHGGLLTSRKTPVKKPVYVQVVELPPDYKAPESLKALPRTPKRYADRTSVVEVEKIPEAKAVVIGPLAGSKTEKKAPGAKTSRAARAEKKSSKTSKPSKIFKPAEETASRRSAKKAKSPVKEKTAALKKTGIKGAMSDAAALEHEREGLVVLKSDKIKEPERKGSLKETQASKNDNSVKKRVGEENAGAAVAPSAPSRPRLLLSEGQVTALTRQYRGSAPTSKSKTLMLNTSELKYQSYLIEIKRKIEQYWEYPRAAARQGWEGKLFIDMTIKRDGTLSYIKLTRSSRYPSLDDAALTAIKLSSPFTTFPENFDIDEINIHGQFVYTLINMPIH